MLLRALLKEHRGIIRAVNVYQKLSSSLDKSWKVLSVSRASGISVVGSRRCGFVCAGAC